MSNNMKLLILIILTSIISRLHIWDLDKNYKRLLEEKQEKSTEEYIYKYLYNLSKIQAKTDYCYFIAIIIVVLLFFKI